MDSDITIFRMIAGKTIYIGKTKSFQRLKQIYEKSLERRKFGEPFQTAYLHNFNVVQFEILFRKNMQKEEIQPLLDKYRDEAIAQGFTVANPTHEEKTAKGIKRTNATRTRMTEVLKERWKEGGDMREVHKNRKITPETKARISAGVKNYHATKDFPPKEKISRRMKHYYDTEK